MTVSAATLRSPWVQGAAPDELARWLPVAESAAAVLAEGALQRDRENASPREALQVLRDAGLANLLVPTAEGGHGASWETAFAILRVIARAVKPLPGSARMARTRPPPCAPVAPTTAMTLFADAMAVSLSLV